jgi:hypothetical protein
VGETHAPLCERKPPAGHGKCKILRAATPPLGSRPQQPGNDTLAKWKNDETTSALSFDICVEQTRLKYDPENLQGNDEFAITFFISCDMRLS